MKNFETKSETDNSKYLMYSIANYKPNLDKSLNDILTKLLTLMVEYTLFVSCNLPFNNYSSYYYKFDKGLETIIHVFKLTLYYTRNLELAFYHSQKSYYLYAEYIQVMNCEETSYIKLNTNGAMICSYTKSIYDINNEYKKNMPPVSEKDCESFELLDKLSKVYKLFVSYYFKKVDSYNTKKINSDELCSVLDALNNLFNQPLTKDVIECIHLFAILLINKSIEISEFISLISEFTKKITQKKYFKYYDAIKINIYAQNNNNCNETRISNLVNTIFDC